MLFAAASLLSVGCTSDDDTANVVKRDTDEVNLAYADGSTSQITVRYDGRWEAEVSTGCDWLTLSTDGVEPAASISSVGNGTDYQYLSITAERNTGDARSAVVYLRESGSQQALDILCRMPFPNGKQTILLEQPAYYGMVKSVYLCNSRVIGIRKDFDGIDFDELERLFLYGDIKFFYTIPRYHNPTGHSYSKQEKETLVRLARKYNVYIVEDDIAADFDTDSRNDPLYYYDISDKVIYVKSFSKILMPGLRVSALVLPPLLKNIFLEYKEWTDTYTSILSQGSLAVYLESGLFNKYQDSIRQLYINRMKILRETAEEHPYSNIRWNIPDSGFFACMKLNSEVPFQQLQPYLFKNKISLMDTSNFFLNEYKNYSYYRVSLSKANEKEIQTGIPVLLNILSGLQPR